MSFMDYLYFLQNIRQSNPSIIHWLMVIISEFVLTGAPVIAVYIMLCVDTSKGYWIAMNFGCGHMLNSTVKMTVCRYRPWVLDSRIELASEVEGSSGGYSLPSGHTTGAMNFYGSIAILYRKIKIYLFSGFMILLTAFARNYLGAHTVWDVLAAILENVVLLTVSTLIFKYLEKYPDKDTYIFALLVVLGIAAFLYVTFKSYPMDYLPDGSLLVDPEDMLISYYKDAGMYWAIIIGWIVTRRFSDFSVEGTRKEKVLRFITGVAPFGILFVLIPKLSLLFMSERWSGFFGRLLPFIWITTAYPLALSRYQKNNVCNPKSVRIKA